MKLKHDSTLFHSLDVYQSSGFTTILSNGLTLSQSKLDVYWYTTMFFFKPGLFVQ